jgi:nucleolar protein 56
LTAYLAFTAFGYFILDDKGTITAKHVLYPDSELGAKEIAAINQGVCTTALAHFTETIPESVDPIVVSSPKLAEALKSMGSHSISVEETSSIIGYFSKTQESNLLELKMAESTEALLNYQREVSIRLAKSVVRSASREKDLLVKHGIDGIDEIDRAINVLAMRLREWYSLHYPSLSDQIEDHEVFSKIVMLLGNKSGMNSKELQSIGLTAQAAESIVTSVSQDIGAELTEPDILAMRGFAERILALFDLRRELETYVAQIMAEIAPNITALAGPLVGARLVSLAGSVKALASRPSSTVQLYGAEKALFRSLKTGADPPKHGVIFQVPEVHSAPYWQRGKIARALAGKLAIAARVDAYSGRDLGSQLRAQFEARVHDIQVQKPEPPPPKPPKPVQKQSVPVKKGTGSSKKPYKKQQGGRRK